MLHRFRIPLVAGLVGIATLVAPGSAPAGAGPVAQDLQLSVASGAAGDVVTVASASCVLPPDADGFRFLQVRFLSGAAPDEVLAGAGTGEGTATFGGAGVDRPGRPRRGRGLLRGGHLPGRG